MQDENVPKACIMANAPPREVQKSLHTHVIMSHVAKTLTRTRRRATSQEP